MLSRLREDWQHPHPPQYSTQPHNNGNRYQEPEENTPEATLGIIVHRILWRLSHLKTLPSATADWINQQTPYWQQLLHLHRVDATEHHTFIQRITPIILQTLSDPRGRWILHQHHDAQSEYRIQQYQPEMREFIIDRTFIADQTRWIIDYKCSPCDTDIDGFLK
jgi:ATP-dependent helicase/nuclease subunit A